ncbi:MAG: ABC transporter substrate-binding protein [Clostridia bacterium]|nr:ABC transporter substrate-binding protein [Clostridia bacterium]
MKKIMSLVLALALVLSCASALAEGSVYYLNFKPEQDTQWQELAAAYTAETGVPVTVVTAASGNYETTLASEIEKSNPPTLFQVNGPVGLANWEDFCYDLSGSELYSHLKSDDFALIQDGKVMGIAYVIETYGIIANTALLEKAGYKASDITDFASLKAVADDIHARSAELGFDAFTSAGMDGSSDWRFKTHLANMPLYLEYKARGDFSQTATIEGTALDNYKNIWDLYITDSACNPAELSAKTGNDAVAEFVGEKAVFYQNGTWAWGDVSVLGAENLTMLPIYTGAEGEANQGLCTGTENYWCVNGEAKEEDIQATLGFLNWVITSDLGRKVVSQDMGFVAPFDTFTGEYASSNPLIQVADQYIADGKTSVNWCFPTMPSESWKDGVGTALTAYAAGTGDWNAVVSAFVDGWATEYALAH